MKSLQERFSLQHVAVWGRKVHASSDLAHSPNFVDSAQLQLCSDEWFNIHTTD